MKNSDLILIGAGGHAISCIDVLECQGLYQIRGLVGLKNELNTKKNGYSVIGTEVDLPHLFQSNKNCLIAIGQIKSFNNRKRLFEKAKKIGFNFPSIISSKAHVSRFAKIGEGTIVMHGAIINSGAQIGKNCIINSQALIEHDVKVGDNCHISTGSILNGGVNINKGCFFGSKSVAKEGVIIGSNCIIGMGSIVRKNISENSIHY